MSITVATKRFTGQEFDGRDFAAPADRRNCYRVTVLGQPVDPKAYQDGGSVSLWWIDHDGDAYACAGWVHFGGQRILSIAEADFAARMEAQGLEPGMMPQAGGEVYLARAIGEELGALLMCCDCHQASMIEHVDRNRLSPTNAALWVAASPAWRRKLWHMVAPIGQAITLEQRVAVSAAGEGYGLNSMLMALRQCDAQGNDLGGDVAAPAPGVRVQSAHELRRAHEQRTRREKEAKAREERRIRAEARAKERKAA